MKKRVLILLFLMIFTALSWNSGNAYSCHSGGRCGQGGVAEELVYPSLHEKFFMKVNFLMTHRSELELSKDQVESVQAIVFEAKRAILEFESEKNLAMLEIYRNLMNESSDVEAMKSVSDKKNEAKKSLDRSLIDFLIRIKGVLTPDQRTKVKELYLNDKYTQCFHPETHSAKNEAPADKS